MFSGRMTGFACALLLVTTMSPARPAIESPRSTPDLPPAPSSIVEGRRPAALIPLYVGFAGLQAADYASTTRALSSGAGREANPLMAEVVGNRAAFAAVKVASTAGAIWAGEKMWRKNRVGAVIFMVAVNGAMAAVVAHNQTLRK